ncbi:MAG: response regulator transcription factor [Candidatus Zixiibacteriota bacterium]|jgi:DNA-binding NarL/FixJ family response regulator
MQKQPIRIFIVDNQSLFREGLVALFSQDDDFEVVGNGSTGTEAVEQTAVLNPDVIIMNVILPILDGISAARRIKERHPRTEIVFLSESHNDEQLRGAFESGARCFLFKGASFEELIYAVKKAAQGDYYISGPASQDLVAEYVRPLVNSQRPGGLMTPREREIARLLADGYSTKEVADVLNISPKTAETHRASIMKKLNARNVTDIVKYCIRNHIIEP